jgi:hypothetical protein
MRNFLLGLAVGCGLMFCALTYHVLRADDGFHLVPKLEASFGQSYVDICDFTVQDWMEHRSLAAAIIRDDKESLMSDSAEESFRARVRDALRGVVGEE